MKFKISRIDGGVFAREVNPYDKAPVRSIWRSILEAEKNLQEYQLTSESESKTKSWGERIIGQLIEGELVNENGVTKIKI
jgi:hypothetical protein